MVGNFERGRGQLVETQGCEAGSRAGVLFRVFTWSYYRHRHRGGCLLFGHDAVTAQVMSSIKDMLGETGAKAIEAMLAEAGRPAAGILATILGIGALLFAAIGVVVQLKDALKVVWEVEDSKDSGI